MAIKQEKLNKIKGFNESYEKKSDGTYEYVYKGTPKDEKTVKKENRTIRRKTRQNNTKKFLEEMSDLRPAKATTNYRNSIEGYSPLTGEEAGKIRGARNQFLKDSEYGKHMQALGEIETQLALSGGKDPYLQKLAQQHRNVMQGLESQRQAYEKPLKMHELDDELQTVRADNFRGSFGANYKVGRLTQDSNAAWNQYMVSGDEDDKRYAEFLDQVLAIYQENNRSALEDDGLIKKSFAGYLPQFLDQTEATLAGGITGAGIGGIGGIGGAVTGFKVGAVAGSGAYSYNNMRGAAFRQLLAEGVDEETARAAANDEAFISSLIEMADTGIDIATLGIGNLFKSFAKVAAKEGAEAAGKSLLKTVGKGILGYGVNIASEAGQESIQEIISQANLARAKGEKINGYNVPATGKWGLVEGSFNQAFDLSAAEKAQVKESAKEGARIAALMGGATALGTNVTSEVMIRNAGKQANTPETIDQMVEVGLEAGEGTEAHKRATEVKRKQEAGENISARELGKLLQATEQVKENAKTQLKNRAEALNNEGFDFSKKSDVQKILETYGEAGQNALSYDYKSTDGDIKEFHYDHARFYDAGRRGMTFDDAVAEYSDAKVSKGKLYHAYEAGVKDEETSQARQAELANTATVYNETAGVIPNDTSKTFSKEDVTLLDGMAKDAGVKVMLKEKIRGGTANGEYADGIVYIAKDADNLYFEVAKHEITHHLQRVAPAEYKLYRDAALAVESAKQGVSNTTVVDQYIKFASEHDVFLTREQAMDEIAADFTANILKDEKAFREFATNNKRSVVQRFVDSVKDFLKKIKSVFGGDRAKQNQAALEQFNVTVSELERVEQLWKDALKATQAKKGQVSKETQEGSQFSLKSAAEDIGLEYDEKTNSLASQYSLKTWTASKYVQDRDKTVRDLSKKMGVSVDEIEKYLKDISSVASIILADPERLDYESNVDAEASVLKPNSEYKWSLDMSTLCAKRLVYTGTMDAIQKAMPNAILNSEDIVNIRDMMMKKGYEVACGICYVESTRREMGAITQQFIDRYKEAQKTGAPISRLNSKGEAVELTEAGNKGKKFYAESDWTPTLADLNTTDIDIVKTQHPDVYAAYLSFMNARGQAKPKLLETRAEYKGEIAQKFNKSAVKSRNAAGGLRVQSFSDFEVPHMIDMMQAVFDMYTVGLKSQAYTKVPEFAAVFGDTGMKINLSLIAKGDGLDADGNLIFDDVEGIDHKRAFELREQYSKNVGTILVGKNDRHIIAAMADPTIDFVIPFHKSSWREDLYDKLGLTGYEDYTATQNEKSIDPSRKIKNFDPSEYWDFSKSGDENAQIYLEKCREDGRVPKFPQFSHYPGYWKLLIDFKMYDNDGTGSPQMPVQPNFNMEAAEQILADYEEGHRSFPVAQDVVDEFVNNYKESGRTYSLKGQSNILKENARLKKYNDYLKNELKLTKDIKPDKKAMQRLTKDVLKEYKSTVPAAEIQPQFDELYSYLTKPDADWNEAKNKALDIANDMLKDATAVDTELQQEFNDFKEYLKGYRISISDEAKGDFKGEWNEFRKRNFGWLTLTNDGQNIDSVYQGLADMFPQHFDAGIENEADQLMEVEKVYNQLKNVEYNPYSNDMEVAAEYLANDIIDRFFDIPRGKPTFADKKKTQIDRIRQDSRERVKAAVKKEREKNEKKLQTYKEQQKESRKKMSDKRKRKIMREKILRHIKPMQKKLLSPTDKQHVPEELRTSVAAALNSINLQSNRLNNKGLETQRTEAFNKAREEFEKIIAAGETAVDPALFGLDGNDNKFNEIIKMKDKKLDDMTLEELETVWEVVKAMEAAINNYGKMLTQARYAVIDDFAVAFREESNKRKTKSGMIKNFGLDLETPYTYFSHFGQPGMDFYRMLRNAQDYEQTIIDELAEKVSAVVSKEQRKQFEKKIHTFETENGDTINLTTAHIMELYVAVRREQFAGHLYRGGMVQPEINRKIRRGTDAVKITETDTAKMFKALTQEEKDIADAMQKITLFLANKGNEASMKAYGYKKFTDPNYWTIKSAKEGLTQTVEKGQNQARSIANMGSAKAVVPNASNPLELGGMFNTFDQHASDMVTYSAWLLPMEDANRLFNFKFKDENGVPTGRTLQGIINRVAGEKADQYWLNLMRDIQNGIGSPSDDAWSGVINKAINNVKKASVSTNLRVVIQQPTAIFRAMAAIDPLDLIPVINNLSTTKGRGWKKALKYAPIAARKATGGFDVAMSPAQLSETLYTAQTKKGKAVKGIKEAPTWLTAKADEVTWGTIWNACEQNIGKTRKDLEKGSEAFYEAVAEKFTDVIDQTQVVDGVLQRSQIMRSSKDFNRQATSFMGEPIMSLNLLLRGLDQVRYQTGKERSAGIKKLGRAVIALLISNSAVALAQSVIDAARDDETDEEYLARLWKAFFGKDKDDKTWEDILAGVVLEGNLYNANNLVTWIPYIKDIHSMLQGYTVERMDAAAFADLISATENAIKSFSGEGKWSRNYAIIKTATTAAKIFGSSAGNLVRDVEGIYRTLLIQSDDYMKLYDLEKSVYNAKNQKSHFIDMAYKALKSGDEESYEYIVADMIDNGVEASYIQSAIKRKAKNDPDFGEELEGFDTTNAAAGIKFTQSEEEEEEEADFDLDSLTGEEYVEYLDYIGDEYQTAYNNLKDYGLYEFEADDQEYIESRTYNYIASQALRSVAGGRYEEDREWVLSADKAVAAGVDPARYFIVKKKYSVTDAKRNGITIRGLKKQRLAEYLNSIPGLTESEYYYFWKEVFGYK